MIPAEITAYGGAIAAVVAAWVVSGNRREKKIYEENGFEHQTDNYSRTEHDQCLKNREAVESRLFFQIETNRKENREDMGNIEKSIVKLTDEAREGREKICAQIEGLTKKVYKQGG